MLSNRSHSLLVLLVLLVQRKHTEAFLTLLIFLTVRRRCHRLTVPPSGLSYREAAPQVWAFLVGPWSHAFLAGMVY